MLLYSALESMGFKLAIQNAQYRIQADWRPVMELAKLLTGLIILWTAAEMVGGLGGFFYGTA